MDDDPFAFWHGLEKDLADVLDEAGLAALARQVQTRLDAPLAVRHELHELVVGVRARMPAEVFVIGLLVQAGETERLAALVNGSADDELQDLSHYALEPAGSGEVPGAGDAAAVPARRRPPPHGRHRRGPGQPG
jgi:hypothetical protein